MLVGTTADPENFDRNNKTVAHLVMLHMILTNLLEIMKMRLQTAKARFTLLAQ